jgi:hypothetical protein
VESRGKAIRLQHLTPIPCGESLAGISQAVQDKVDRAFAAKVDVAGVLSSERFAEEAQHCLALPAVALPARRVVLVSVSRRSVVRIEAVQYSVPSPWAGLEATAYVGVETIRLVCRGEEVEVAKQRRGTRAIRYRHYLPELAKKPQAVRQVAPELVAELGEPYGRLWEVLVGCHGVAEASRVLSRIVGAIVERGESEVASALSRALSQQRCDLLELPAPPPPTAQCIEVPPELSTFAVEAARATDYDWLLQEGSLS